MSCEAIDLSECSGCADAAAYVTRMRREQGAFLTVVCDACGARIEARRERTQPGPRAPTAAELEQRAARDLDQWLRDAAAIARWRAHAARECTGVLAKMQGVTTTAGTSAEADTLRAPATDGDRERDLRRGRALDAVLRGLEAACADKRSVAVLVHCVERVGAERTRFKSPAELVGAAFSRPPAHGPHVSKRDREMAEATYRTDAAKLGAELLARAVAVWTTARGSTQKSRGEMRSDG